MKIKGLPFDKLENNEKKERVRIVFAGFQIYSRVCSLVVQFSNVALITH